MNNLNSLAYFIPEIILFGLILLQFLFYSSGRRSIVIVQQVVKIAAVLTALLFYISYWYIRPAGIFFNHFAVDPFTSFLSIILIVFFIFTELLIILKLGIPRPYYSDLFRTTLLFATLLLIKSNSLIAVSVSIVILHCSCIALLHRSPAIKSNFPDFAFHFIMLIFTFALIYAFRGTWYLSSGILSPLHIPPFSNAIITILLVLGFGLFSLILPFQYQLRKPQDRIEFNEYLMIGLIPLLAFFGIAIRFFRWTDFPLQFSLNHAILLSILAIIIMITANLFYRKKIDIDELLMIAITVHAGISLVGLAGMSAELISASIFLTVSTILIFSGILMSNQLLNCPTLPWKILSILYYFGLIGMPGTSGFIGRFLIFRAYLHSEIPIWLTLLLIIASLPLFIFFINEILKLIRLKSERGVSKNIVLASLPAVLMILLGIFWEPFYYWINQSLVFFQF